jgi:tetratricopeptide (TPR) repeat protein
MVGQGGEGTFEDFYAQCQKSILELDYRKSMNLLNKMLEISEDDLQEYWTRVGFATLSLLLDGEDEAIDLSDARKLANYALSLSKKKENQKMELDAKELIALIEHKSGNWHAVIEINEDLLLLSEELDDADSTTCCHLTLSKAYSMMKLFKKAKLHLEHGYNGAGTDPILLWNCDATKIQYLLALGNDTIDTDGKLISTKEEIQKIADKLVSNDQVPYVFTNSQDLIQNSEKLMGTSLFSSDLQQSNIDEVGGLTSLSNEEEGWELTIDDTVEKQNHEILRLQHEVHAANNQILHNQKKAIEKKNTDWGLLGWIFAIIAFFLGGALSG